VGRSTSVEHECADAEGLLKEVDGLRGVTSTQSVQTLLRLRRGCGRTLLALRSRRSWRTRHRHWNRNNGGGRSGSGCRPRRYVLIAGEQNHARR